MRLQTRPGRPLTGRLRVPGDKSISHRSLLFNGIAGGDVQIEGLLQSLDVKATASCLRLMGVQIDEGRVRGDGLREPTGVLDCGNSGTSMRLLCGVLAAQPFFSVLDGDRHLRRRPMRRVTDPLSRMGARFDGRDGANLAPIAVRGGGLTALTYTSPIASAQVKSALLLAAVLGGAELRFKEPHRSRDHTERMLRAMGARIDELEDGTLVVPEGQTLTARDVVVPGDVSSAAFFLVAASITPGSDLLLENVGMNPTRSGVLDALEAMGADITVLNLRDASGEPVADLRVRHAGLQGCRIEGALIPRLIDEVPVLAVAAAFAEGETVFADAADLRVKESDRITATVTGLLALGVDASERPDGLVVRGGPVHGGVVDSLGDHRIAMAALVAGCAAQAEVTALDCHNVATSFPNFMDLMGDARA